MIATKENPYVEIPKCFYCTKPVLADHIIWHGEVIMRLHEKCAKEFACHLISDSHKMRSKRIERERKAAK